jgi:ABC-type uncharacterized transport system permease subunit
MKSLKLILGAAGLFLAAITTQAQISLTNVLTLTAATNVAVVPYGIYRTDNHFWGFGVAGLYKVTDNFWAGFRADDLDHNQTTAGVQVNLQATVDWNGIGITPFATASTGIGKSTLYGSAGSGLALNFHTWSFNVASHKWLVSLGAAGDYEHVVLGSQNWNQVCGGPWVKLSF